MKTWATCIVVLLYSLAFDTSTAQVRICVWCASNLSEQPSWGPAGYDYVYYYYMPEIEVYYYVPDHQFIYKAEGAWIISNTLPLRYAVFNFYKAYKVVMNAGGIEPYLDHNVNKVEYASYKSKHDQPVNRDSEDYKRAKQKEKPEGLTVSGGGI